MAMAFWVIVGVLPAWLFEYIWVFDVTAIGYVLLAGYLSAYAGVFVWIAGRLRHRFSNGYFALMGAVIWSGLEFFRGEMFLGGDPMHLLGQPLIDWAFVAGIGALGGQYLVSGLAVGSGFGIAVLLVNRRAGLKAVFGVACVIFVLGGAGFLMSQNGSGEEEVKHKLKVAVVQTNVPQENKIGWTPQQRLEDWLEMQQLILEAGQAEPDLIVLPETMFPGLSLDPEALAQEHRLELSWIVTNPQGGDPSISTGQQVRLESVFFADQFKALSRSIDAPIMVGGTHVVNPWVKKHADGMVSLEADARYNSVFVMQGGQVWPSRYDKLKLTPFGEVLPYVSAWSWLESLLMKVAAGGMSFDLDAGSGPRVFEIADSSGGSVTVGTPICFEGAYSGVCRAFVRPRGLQKGELMHKPAELLINLTNDGWFGGFDAGREQHLLAARWRSVELGVPMVRVANTGVSAAIDRAGRVIQRGVKGGQSRVAGVMVVEFDVIEQQSTTMYAVTGNIFGFTMLFLTALGGVWAFILRGRVGGWGAEV